MTNCVYPKYYFYSHTSIELILFKASYFYINSYCDYLQSVFWSVPLGLVLMAPVQIAYPLIFVSPTIPVRMEQTVSLAQRMTTTAHAWD